MRIQTRNRFAGRETWTALGFLLPLAAFAVIFILVPVLGTLMDAFFLDVTFRPRRFIGMGNFIWLFKDPGFGRALQFTGLFVLVSVPLEVMLGLIMALVLNERLPLRGLIRAAVLVPWAVPAVVSGRIFELVYNYSYGAANYVLTAMHLTREPVNWLGSDLGAFLALVIADGWKTTPFAAIILLAGLSAIPQDLYRQARVDRADFIQRFFRITLPLLKPVLIVVLLFRTIEALRVFDLIYVLTGGGPGGATTSVSLFSYDYFSAGDFGYGSAASVVLFFIALGLSLGLIKLGRMEQGIMP
jgi:multiple sugar transport system permease protein